MTYSSKFRFSVQVFVLALFVAANCGFTAIVRHCTMISPEKMMCCDQAQTSANDDRANGESSLTISASDCHTSFLAGGLSTAPALLEKTIIVQSSKTIPGILSQEPHSGLCCLDNQPTLLSVTSNEIAPPAVEKCVLNSSFLI